MANQIVSKQRVTDHGEVLTAPREVNAMLDLVKSETERIDSRFLEPACGNGNFLAEILERKLRVVALRYARSRLDYERKAVLAVSSIYGIDLLEDNVTACRTRLFGIFDRHYSGQFKTATREECRDSVRYILERNIIHGNALTLTTVGANPRPIVFSEWSFSFDNSQVKRRDFTFHGLLGHEGIKELPLFSDLGDDVFIPTPEKEYPPTHFTEISHAKR